VRRRVVVTIGRYAYTDLVLNDEFSCRFCGRLAWRREGRERRFARINQLWDSAPSVHYTHSIEQCQTAPRWQLGSSVNTAVIDTPVSGLVTSTKLGYVETG